MTISIRPVQKEHVQQTWPLVYGYIEESISKGLPSESLDYSIDNVRWYVASGHWLLLVAVDEDSQIHGAMTISFIDLPLNRIAFITTTGGKHIINRETFDQLQAVVKFHGATKIQAMARDSMVKLLKTCDMVPCNTLMEYKL